EQWFFPLAVAAGVTGVRDMGGRLERVASWRRPSSPVDSMSLRPVWSAAVPIVTGAPDDPDPRVVHVSEPGRAAVVVDSLVAGGADFVKVHDWLTLDVYRALAVRARFRGIRLAGHLPIEVDPAEAGAARQ